MVFRTIHADMGAAHTHAMLKKFPNVPRFRNFRQMCDKMGREIDAVSVGTPDFLPEEPIPAALDFDSWPTWSPARTGCSSTSSGCGSPP